MTRLLAFWGIFSVTLCFAALATGYGIFSHIDLTYEWFAMLVCVPAFQALVLACATSRRPQWSVQDRARLFRPQLTVPLLSIDAVVVPLGLLLHGTRLIGFGGDGSVQPVWIATKAILGGATLAVVALQRRGDTTCQPPYACAGRVAPAAFAACLAAAGGQALHPWIGVILSTAESTILGRQPLVLLWLEAYGLLCVVFVTLALRAGVHLRHRWPAAPLLWESGIGLSVCAALMMVLNGFLFRVPIEPFRTVALVCCSAAVTLFLLTAQAVAAADTSSQVAGG